MVLSFKDFPIVELFGGPVDGGFLPIHPDTRTIKIPHGPPVGQYRKVSIYDLDDRGKFTFSRTESYEIHRRQEDV